MEGLLKNLIFFSTLFFATQLIAAIPELDPAYDVTSRYHNTYITDDSSTAGQKLLNELSKHQIVLVPGLHYTKMKDMFAPQLEWLEKNNLDYVFIKTNPGGQVEENSQFIREYIVKSQKSLLLFNASKGAVDTLAALLSLVNEKDILKNVRASVNLQAPFYGSPLADMVQNTTNPILIFFIKVFLGGDTKSIADLTLPKRDEIMKRDHENVIELNRFVPTISLTTWRPLYETNEAGEEVKLDSELWQTNKLMLEEGYKNDGMVPLYSACLPRTPCVVLEKVDHASTTSYKMAHPFDAISAMRTLISIGLGL